MYPKTLRQLSNIYTLSSAGLYFFHVIIATKAGLDNLEQMPPFTRPIHLWPYSEPRHGPISVNGLLLIKHLLDIGFLH